MRLAPELQPPRDDPRRVAVVLLVTSGLSLALAGALIAVGARAAPPAAIVPVPVPVVTREEVAVPAAEPAGEPAMEPTVHLTSADDELANEVEAWLANDDGRIAIEARTGVLFIESAEDRGDDGPYPRSAAPEAQRVCGSAATWLRAYLRTELRRKDLTCGHTECSYPGMEYAPSGRVGFRRAERDGATVWVLEEWTQSYDAGLAPSIAEDNDRFVTASLRRLAGTRCAGEPAGVLD